MTVQATTASITAEDTAACPFCGATTAPGRPFCTTCGQPGAALLPGTKLHSAYAIVEVLSASATGAVYRAQDTRRRREVAIKELLAPVGISETERAALQSAFVREVRQLSVLKHPCLPTIHDSFSQDGRHYLVMGLIPGQNLSSVLDVRRQGFPEAQVRAWAPHLFSLLEYLQAHHPAFVHGEIMPAHMMARPDGVPVLIEYGLSWRLGLRPRIALPGAAAPEPGQPSTATRRLHLGRKEPKGSAIDQPLPRDDLYGVAAVIHAMLTGRDVFGGVAELALAFPLVRDLAPRVSVGTAEAVNRALSPDYDVRFTSIAAFRSALGISDVGPVQVVTYRPPTDRRRVTAFGILLVAFALIAGLVVYDQRNIGSGRTAAPGEINPNLVVPFAAHTLALNDMFTQSSAAWPTDDQHAFLRGSELWLSNTSTGGPIKLTRSAYATGPNGFIARATMRLTQGPATATYGLVAADRAGGSWDNVALVIGADGRWALLRYQHNHAPAIVTWRHSSAIRTGHNTPNELQLTLRPGKPGHHGTFTIALNGLVVAANVPAWGTAPSGRLGLLAGPGAVMVADSVIVSAPGPSKVSVEDHFLNNRLTWALNGSPGATSPVHKGLLHLGPAVGVPWRTALPHRLVFPPLPATVTEELTADIHARTLHGQQAGGLVFARPPVGHKAPTLAALMDMRGNVSIVALSGRTIHTLAGPIPDSSLRLGSGPNGPGVNLLRVRTSFTHATISTQVMINGRMVAHYSGANPGVAPATGLVTIGDVGVDASALRLYGRGIHL